MATKEPEWTSQQRYEVEPEQFAKWKVVEGEVILYTTDNCWIQADKVMEVIE